MQTTNSDFIDIMEKNHMEIPWHDYANDDSNVLIAEAGLIEKASVIVGYDERVYLRHVAAFCEAYDFIHIIGAYLNEPCYERIAIIYIDNGLEKAHSDASNCANRIISAVLFVEQFMYLSGSRRDAAAAFSDFYLIHQRPPPLSFRQLFL